MRMRRTLTKLAAVGGALALGLTGAAVAEEDEGTTVAIASVVQEGSALTVTGSSSYVDQPFVELATDPAGDSTLPGATGGDLTGVALAAGLNQTISFRWTVSELPPVANGTPLITYNWNFCIDGDAAQCFWINASRIPSNTTSATSADPTAPNGEVWYCETNTCSRLIRLHVDDVVFDGPSNTVTMTLPLLEIFALPGSIMNPTGVRRDCAVWTTVHYLDPSTVGDSSCFETPYEVAQRTVSLAVDAPGLDPADVAYTADVSPAANGGYAGTVDVGGLSGPHAVYVRACFGANNCGYVTHDMDL